MDAENIINNIRAKREEINNETRNKEAQRDAYMVELEARVRVLAPRLAKMFDIAEALVANRFDLGRRATHSPSFCTDPIAHRLGFFCKQPLFVSPSCDFSLTGFFGIANGGACGSQDLKVDRDGRVIRFDFSSRYTDYKRIYINDLERLLGQFDDFEQAFYEYANNPISR